MTQQETIYRNEIHRRLSDAGLVLFRNNVGVAKITDCKCPIRRIVKYGVCNPGGSDLIGYRVVTITPEMVGRTVAVFLAVETKIGKRPETTEQEHFRATVTAAVGIAVLSRDVKATMEAALRNRWNGI